jgi:[ribosomal protein S18]-alanine N-acetyltransferase
VSALAQADPGELHVRVQRMRRRHLRAVLRIERQVYPRPWTVGVFTSEISNPERCYVVARVGSTLVGYGGMLFSGDDAHVANVAVDPRWHRHKVGSRLLLTMARFAREHGYKNLTLEVRVTNTGAQAMYHRFGFAPAGIRPRYYENTEDAIVMWANDIDQPAFAHRLAGIEADIGGSTAWDVG